MRQLTKQLTAVFLVIAFLILSVSHVFAAEEGSLSFGTMDFYDSKPEDNVVTDSYCYSDDWFFEDATKQNDRLALASMQLVAAASDADADGLAASYLKELGFTETGVGRYDADDPYDCVYVWGKKTIGKGANASTLVAVAFQSYAFDDETKLTGWKQNFGINGKKTTGEHDSFAKAVNNVIEDVAALGGDGKTKFWISGQSRGGALAGMLSAKLPSRLSDADIYTCTFESPAQVDGASVKNASSYAYIHNYISTDDIVTMIPPWGMVRYGVDHVLNTEEVDANLAEQLTRMGVQEPVLPYTDVAGTAKKILDAIQKQVSTRADYSAEHTDTFKDSKGNKISVTYVWQDLFQKLMEIIFSDALSGISMDTLANNIASLAPAVGSMAKGLKNDSNADYYDAAVCVKKFLKDNEIALPLDEAELYALLKLVAPLLIDTSYEPQSETLTTDDMMGYLSPFIMLYLSRNELTFSHQFINIIARLHVLAGDPLLENMDLTINAPAAGDASETAPEELKAFVKALGNNWLKVSAKWASSDDPLKDGKVYYLDVTLEAVGHMVPDDYSLTLNGKEPIEPLAVSYKNGAVRIDARYAFTIGNPKKVTISFDAQEITTDPKPQSVNCGERLKYAISPEEFDIVTHDKESFRFGGWYDKKGTFWEDIYADEDVTLYAKWIRRIDFAEVSYKVPHIGGKLVAPTVPDGAHYKVASWYVRDEDWNNVTAVESGETLILQFILVPVDDSFEFAIKTNEEGSYVFEGKVLFNGKEIKVDYDEEANGLVGEYEFTPLKEEVTETDPQTETKETAKTTDSAETHKSETAKPQTETTRQNATTRQAVTTQQTTTQRTTIKSVKTGDESSSVLWWILLSAAIAAIITTVWKTRRSKE